MAALKFVTRASDSPLAGGADPDPSQRTKPRRRRDAEAGHDPLLAQPELGQSRLSWG